MDFAYSARKIDGSAITGLLEAETLQEARIALRQQGLFVLNINAASRAVAAAVNSSSHGSSNRWGQKKISRHDVMMLTSQLAIMSRSGVELADAIQNLSETSPNVRLKTTLQKIHESLQQGVQLSAAMKAHPEVFDEVFVSAVRAGEASGQMTEVLDRLADMLRNEDRMRSAIRGALAYPAVLLAISFLVLLAVIFFVLPQFSQVFKDVGVVPPATTGILLSIGESIRNHWFVVFPAFGISIVAAVAFARTVTFRRFLEHAWLNFPVTRSAARSLSTGRVFRLLGMMLHSGIPLLESLQLCSRTVGNQQFRQLMDTLEQEVTLGHMIGPVLARSSFLPPGAAQMIITAERTGKMSEVFDLCGCHFEDDGERQLRDRVKLLEPAVIVIMGALVGFIVASVMLPLLDFSSIGSRR
ncbi:MAG: type II secretion system F family protein [Planctomycetaceae bacterium]|nr:type II secretion system F family protein [Planctomycetaceae bacterium]